MKFKDYINEIDFLTKLESISDLLSNKADVKITFWGGRVIQVDGYGSISIEDLSRKILNTPCNTYSDNYHKIKIIGSLEQFYGIAQSEIEKSNWFTKTLGKIRNLSIFNQQVQECLSFAEENIQLAHNFSFNLGSKYGPLVRQYRINSDNVNEIPKVREAPITLEDVEKVTVESTCFQTWPCQHASEIILKDGRKAHNLNSFQISSVVSKIELEKINPDKNWNGEKIKKHFKVYNRSIPEMGWIAESPEVVLNKIFSRKKENQKAS